MYLSKIGEQVIRCQIIINSRHLDERTHRPQSLLGLSCNINAIDKGLTRCRQQEICQYLDGSGLPGAIGPQVADYIALHYIERNIVKNLHTPDIFLVQIFYSDRYFIVHNNPPVLI